MNSSYGLLVQQADFAVNPANKCQFSLYPEHETSRTFHRLLPILYDGGAVICIYSHARLVTDVIGHSL